MELRELISTFGEEEVKSWFSQYKLSDYLTQEQIAVINDKGVWSKEQLETRIINHFYTREIGTDAVGQFILFVKDKMAEIMETYVPLIYTASIKFDPLVNVDFTETYSGSSSTKTDQTTTSNDSNSASSESSSESSGSGLTVNSDTPQGQISKTAILGGTYASSAGANETENTVSDSSSNSSSHTGSSASNGNESGVNNYVKSTRGNSGVSATAQKMIEQTRDIIRAINTEIVYELEPLFMGLY